MNDTFTSKTDHFGIDGTFRRQLWDVTASNQLSAKVSGVNIFPYLPSIVSFIYLSSPLWE